MESKNEIIRQECCKKVEPIKVIDYITENMNLILEIADCSMFVKRNIVGINDKETSEHNPSLNCMLDMLKFQNTNLKETLSNLTEIQETLRN